MNLLAFFCLSISILTTYSANCQNFQTESVKSQAPDSKNIKMNNKFKTHSNKKISKKKKLKLRKNKNIIFYNDNEMFDLFIINQNYLNKQCFYIQVYSGHNRKVALEYLNTLDKYVDKKCLHIEYLNTIYKLYIGISIEKLELSKLYIQLFEIFHNIRIMSVRCSPNICDKLCLDFDSMVLKS